MSDQPEVQDSADVVTSAEPVEKKGVGRPRGPAKTRKLTARQKAEAAALWSAGDATLHDLSVRYGKTKEHLSRTFTKMGVKKGERAREAVEEAKAAIAKEMVSDSAELAKKVRAAKDDSDRFYTTLRKLTLHEIITAKKSGLPLSAIFNNLKSLEVASKIARITQEGQFEVLGISTEPVELEDDIPELRITGLSSDQIEELRNTQSTDQLDALDDGLDDGRDPDENVEEGDEDDDESDDDDPAGD